MKVKYIKSEDLYLKEDSFQKAINEFIKDKKVIDMKFQEYPIKEDDENYISANILIMYEED